VGAVQPEQIYKLVKLANILDEKGLYREANEIDLILIEAGLLGDMWNKVKEMGGKAVEKTKDVGGKKIEELEG
jgi:hypothetical protein